MNTFEASNTATVEKFTESLEVKLRKSEHWLEPWIVQALREFFRREHDIELGRWRYPKDPRYVVYGGYSPGEERRFARVVQEQMGIVSIVYEGKEHQSEVHDIAVAYFEAHPERKPWRDAADKDIWALTIDGKEDVYVVIRSDEAGFRFFPARATSFRPGAFPDEVTAGRRIWPEEDAS